jgi:glycosyltransferase involved in cell wall biosynthesis
MIKVVLCTDGVFPQAMGGMQRHSRLLAEHLARSGEVELTVIHPHAAGVFQPGAGIRELAIAPIDPHKFYLRELWAYSGRVADALDGLAPDVILSQGFSVWKGMARFRERLIVHPHGLEMFQGITRRERVMGAPFRIALRYIVRRCRFVISLGGRLTTILEKLAAGSGSTVVTVPNAVDVPITPVAYTSIGRPLRLLFVGRFAFNKGLDVLMAVARRLEREGHAGELLFELAGDGPLLATYQGEGLPPNVHLLGRVDDERLFRLYAECDAFVLPTRFEGMPTVVLEAMARSRPIFVSDVGASAELVDATNGYLLPKGDVDALYTALLAFVGLSLESRRALAEASWQRARARFDWTAVTQQFIALFQKVRNEAP